MPNAHRHLGRVVLAALVLAAAAAASPGTELATSNLNTPAGHVTAIASGVSYGASSFPIPISVTPLDGDWGGTQWTTASHGKPVFGWVAFSRGPADGPPQGIVEIASPLGASPSTASILARLRSAGGGATFGPTTRVRLAGPPAWQIDGHVFGRFGHVFVPFTTKTGGASPPDHDGIEPGEDFRLVVLDVRGRRVVLIMDSAALAQGMFPTFLAAADRLLATLRFPAS